MTLDEIGRLAASHKLGVRGTPVISFWPMREKWRKFGAYWEQWGTDGDTRMVDSMPVLPAILKLIYFVVPDSGDMVCQIAYIHAPEEVDNKAGRLERDRLVSDNMKAALNAVKAQAA